MACLPSSPGYASVTRIDWMSSLILRSPRRPDSCMTSVGQELLADELLGDRRAAARVAGEGVEGRRDDAQRVEAGVGPERLVLDGRDGVGEDGRHVVPGDDRASLAAGGDARQHRLAVAGVDDRFLGEDDGLEVVRVGQAAAVDDGGADDGHEAEDGRQRERAEDEQRRARAAPAVRRPLGCRRATGSAAALAAVPRRATAACPRWHAPAGADRGGGSRGLRGGRAGGYGGPVRRRRGGWHAPATLAPAPAGLAAGHGVAPATATLGAG